MADDHKTHLARLREAKQESAQRKAAQPALQATSFFEITEEEEMEFTSEGGSRLWDRLLERVAQKKGEVLFASLMGSRRYNLQTNGSDLDFVIVYLPSLEEVIGAGAQPSTEKQLDNCRPDFSLHSLEHYCQLLSEGDSKCIELLFAHPTTIYRVDEHWKALQAIKSNLITKSMIRNYLGELKGLKGIRKLEKMMLSQELGDLEQKARIDKCAYILLRLVILAERFISGFNEGSLDLISPIWFEETSEDFIYLNKIRSGEFGAQELQNTLQSRLSALELSIDQCTLPDSLDTDTLTAIDEWRMFLRKQRSSLPLDPRPRAVDANLGISIIPGSLLFLSQNSLDHSYFGIYAVDINRKLALFGDKYPLVINTRLAQNDLQFSVVDDGNPALIYELDRFYDALNRNELSTIMAIGELDNLVWNSNSWNRIYSLQSSIRTHTLLYQACGFISGKFKEAKGRLDAAQGGKEAFVSKSVLAKINFAISLMNEALLPENSPRATNMTTFDSMRELLTQLITIQDLTSSIIRTPSNEAKVADLAALGPLYTKKFIFLRPKFAELLIPEIDWAILGPWFLECRFESLN